MNFRFVSPVGDHVVRPVVRPVVHPVSDHYTSAVTKSPPTTEDNDKQLSIKSNNYNSWKELMSLPFLSPESFHVDLTLDNYDSILTPNYFQDNHTVESQYYPLYETPQYPLPINLGEVESSYFDYYCNYIAKEISVVPQNSNYFLNVFLPIAMREKAVLLCLISWGSIFKNLKLNNVFAKETGDKFIKLLMQELSKMKYDKVGKFIPSLACYTILMCIEITTGDTDAWSRYLTKSYDLINDMGGFGILQAFSSEGRFLAKSFAYFDILASQSNDFGTYYSISEYTKMFNLEEQGDMIDSLQGCIRSLILILGEVINIVVELKKVNSLRMEEELYYERQAHILRRCNELEAKARNTKIKQPDLEILMQTGEMEVHLQMFEVYQMTIQLYIKQAVRKIPPIVPEMRSLVFKIKRCLSILIRSRVKPLLGFPLLIAGLNCVTLDEKNAIIQAIDSVISTYEFTNIRKIKNVLREVWSLNQNGQICVDWFEVTKNFGWRLNLGR